MILKTNTMYILSGISCSGKSHFLKTLRKNKCITKDMIVSSDKLRKNILGTHLDVTAGDLIVKNYSDQADTSINEMMAKIIEEKAKERITFFVDAPNLTDNDRIKLARIAKANSMPVEILIFDVEFNEAIERNKNRKRSVEVSKIEEQYSKFEKKSLLKFRLVNDTESVSFETLNVISSNKIDIIGDIHGLHDEFLKLCKKLGYEIKDGVPTHPERKLLLLGDIIDRGPKSVEMIELTIKMLDQGHYCIIGNHELKFIENWKRYNKGMEPHGSHAVLETLLSFLRKVPVNKQEAIVSKIENLPAYYVVGDSVCLHGNVIAFDPLRTLKTDMLYGSCRNNYKQINTDKVYHDLYKKGLNKFKLIRGHIPAFEKNSSVISLEEEQAFNGYLVAYRFDKKEYVREKSNFDYKKQGQKNIVQALEKFKSQKLVSFNLDQSKTMKIFKHNKSYFNQDVISDEVLLQANGLVIDISEKIVVNPLKKVFNYLENGAGLDVQDNKLYECVERFDGFFGCISKHPFKDELLITTESSFESYEVQKIKGFISAEMNSRLLNFLSKNEMTLMFEVIHSDNNSVIKYDFQDTGLWLIGAKELHENSKELSETELDKIAAILEFRRPKWDTKTIKEIKEEARTAVCEGFMVREVDGEILFKIKTSYFLTKKMSQYISNSKIAFMFSNPSKFKETIKPELHEIVDYITTKIRRDEFLELSSTEMYKFIPKVIDLIRS